MEYLNTIPEEVLYPVAGLVVLLAVIYIAIEISYMFDKKDSENNP